MRWLSAFAVVLLLLHTPPTSAQEVDVIDVYLELGDYDRIVPVFESVVVPFSIKDLSRDSTQGLLGPDTPMADVDDHQVDLKIKFISEDRRGWSVNLERPTYFMSAGETIDTTLRVSPFKDVQNLELKFLINVTLKSPTTGVTKYDEKQITVITYGLNSMNVFAPPPAIMKPGEIRDLQLRIQNNALLPRSYDIEISDTNPCDLSIAEQDGNFVDAKTQAEIPISVGAPENKFWYNSDLCSVGITIRPTDSTTQYTTTLLLVTVDGFYVAPEWLIMLFWIGSAVTIFVLLVRGYRVRKEEKIHGKPQKPWTIPVEEVYLKHLKARDHQAWYMVRHHLMEEEYKSALMWYHAKRKASKGEIAKERIIVAHEDRFDTFQETWQRTLAQPQLKVDALARKLQRKLNRKTRKAHKKELKKHNKQVAAMREGHAAKTKRLTEKWEKQAAKAKKKGAAVPDKPTIPEPDYPLPPERQRTALADHKWQKKVDRAQARATKKVGNLEVAYEKETARQKESLRRKIAKIAKQLNDPEFAAEHGIDVS